jgi:hypothetical protein
MAAFRSRATVILAKVETTEGTDAAPVAGTNAVLVENVKGPTPKPNIITTNEVTSSLDDFGAIVGGMTVDLTFDCYIKGNSAGAGNAPEWGALLKGCSWAETITNAAIPAAPEACAAGGSTTTAVLGVTAAATAELYRGMPIALSGTVSSAALNQGVTFISDYTVGKLATLTETLGGAIVATTNYQIPKNVLYAPSSAAPETSLTIYVYNDGVRYRLVGCRGDVTFNLLAGGAAKMSFKFQGLFLDKTDQALPVATYDAVRPPIWKSGAMLLNRLNGAAKTLSLNCQNTLAVPDDPNATEGYDAPVIVKRDPRGTLDPLETLVGTRDIMGDFRASTKRILHARYGTTLGNQIGLTIPQALYLGQDPTDRGGLMAVGVPFEAVGQDSGAFLCLF